MLMEDALLYILENKGIKALTVKSLCETAGINRGTFYLHYKDIFHLIEETAFIQELLSVFEPLNLQELRHFPDHEEAYPPITKAFQYMHKHASFFKALFHSAAPAELKERLQYLVGTRLYENLKRDQADNSESLFTDYAIAYLGNAQFGMIQHWFTTDRSIPPEDIARMLTRYIRNIPCLDNNG